MARRSPRMSTPSCSLEAPVFGRPRNALRSSSGIRTGSHLLAGGRAELLQQPGHRPKGIVTVPGRLKVVDPRPRQQHPVDRSAPATRPKLRRCRLPAAKQPGQQQLLCGFAGSTVFLSSALQGGWGSLAKRLRWSQHGREAAVADRERRFTSFPAPRNGLGARLILHVKGTGSRAAARCPGR